MSHRIVISEPGEGPGGSAESVITYTPSHDIPAVEQIRKAERAGKMLKRINEYLYGNEAYPDD